MPFVAFIPGRNRRILFHPFEGIRTIDEPRAMENPRPNGLGRTKKRTGHAKTAAAAEMNLFSAQAHIAHRADFDAKAALNALGGIDPEMAAVGFGERPFDAKGDDIPPLAKAEMGWFFDSEADLSQIVLSHFLGIGSHLCSHVVAVAKQNVIGHEVVKFLDAKIPFFLEEANQGLRGTIIEVKRLARNLEKEVFFRGFRRGEIGEKVENHLRGVEGVDRIADSKDVERLRVRDPFPRDFKTIKSAGSTPIFC